MDNLHERRALPEGWEWKRLIDALLTLESGSRPKGGADNISEGVPSIGGEHLNKDGGFIFENIKFIPKEFYGDMRRGRIEIGDVLVVKDGATTGKVSLVRDDYPYQESAVNEHVFICRPDQKYVLAEYLFYNLFSPMGKNKILRSFHGAAQGGINTQFANNYEIPLPPLPTQRRIVSLLEKAEETKKLRAQADELTEKLLQSVFLEMFGDPMKNPKGWEIRKIKDISEKFSDGPFGSNLKTEHYENKGVRVIRLQNIGIANFLDDDKAYISEKHFSTLQKHTCFPGDVLIGTMGDPNLRACIIPKSIELAVNKADCIQCRPNKNLATSEYICHLLNLPSTLDMASNMIHGETRSRISMGQLSTLRIPLPPLPLQQKFARIVEKIESMRQSQTQSKQQIEDLFRALMQKAFRGEI